MVIESDLYNVLLKSGVDTAILLALQSERQVVKVVSWFRQVASKHPLQLLVDVHILWCSFEDGLP